MVVEVVNLEGKMMKMEVIESGSGVDLEKKKMEKKRSGGRINGRSWVG